MWFNKFFQADITTKNKHYIFWHYIGTAEIIINLTQIYLVCYLSCHFYPCSTITSDNSLYECSSFKVLNGLLTELCLNVVSPEPFNHIDVGGEVPEGLDSNTKPTTLDRLKDS